MIASLLVLSACGAAEHYPQTTFEPVTEFGRLVNSLFANTFWWTMGIMVLVEVLLLVFVFRFRDRLDHKLAPPQTLMIRVNYDHFYDTNPNDAVVGTNAPTVARRYTRGSRSAQVNHTAVAGATLLNEARLASLDGRPGTLGGGPVQRVFQLQADDSQGGVGVQAKLLDVGPTLPTQ
jgi:hypothetical protein